MPSSRRGWQRAFCLYLAMLMIIIVVAYARLIPVQLAAFPLYDKLGHMMLLSRTCFLLPDP